MDQRKLVAVAKRILGYVDGKTTALGPQCHEHDVRVYTDPALYQREVRKLFLEYPLFLGVSADLAKPGDYLTTDGPGAPILAVRDRDGQVRAFLNVCRHRGARLADGAGNVGGRFTCPYHAWSYDLCGALKAIPGAEGFAGLDRAARHLTALPVQEKYGLIFARATPGPDFNIDDLLGDLGPELAGWNLGSGCKLATKALPAATNWKLAMDTFCEGYHFGPLHPQTIAPTSMTNVMSYDRFGRNHRLGFPNHDIVTLKTQPEETWDVMKHMNFVYFLFPNISLFVTADHFEVFQIYPDGAVDRSITHHSLYTPRPLADAEERRKWQDMHDFIFAVVRDEDYATGARVYQGLRAGAQKTFLFGRNELSLINMHAAFSAAVTDGDPVNL